MIPNKDKAGTAPARISVVDLVSDSDSEAGASTNSVPLVIFHNLAASMQAQLQARATGQEVRVMSASAGLAEESEAAEEPLASCVVVVGPVRGEAEHPRAARERHGGGRRETDR